MPLPRARSRSNDRNARRRTRSRSRRRSRSRSRRREARNHSRSGSRSGSRRREARSRSRRRSRSRSRRREARNHSRSGSRRSSGRRAGTLRTGEQRSYGERKEGRHEDNRGNPVENQIRKENRKGSGRHNLGASFERRFNKEYANEELSNGRLPSEFRKRKKEYNDMKIMRFAWKKRRNHLKRVQYDDASRPDSYAYPDKSSKHSRSEEKPRGASSADGRFDRSSKRVEKQRSTIQQSQNSMHQRQSPLNNAASGQPSTHNVNVPYVSPGNSDLSCTSPHRHHLGKSDGIISTGLEGSEAPTTSSEHSTSTRNQSLTNERVEPATQPRSISMGSSYDAPGYNGVPREPAMSQRMDSSYGHPGHSSSSSTFSNGQDQSGHMYHSSGSTKSGTSSSYPFQTLPESIQDFHEDQRQSPVNNEASRKPAMSQWRDPLYFHPGHSSSSSTFSNGQDQSGHVYDSYGSTRSGTSSSYPTETLPENTQHFPGSRGALETSSNSWKHATDALDQNDVYPSSRPRSKEEEEKSEQYKIFRAESELLDNRFKLLETVIGRGKYGIVFGGKVKKTEPHETERFVAIKKFNNEQDALRETNSGKILVSLREIEMLKKLPKHKNIVEFIAPCHRLENDITSVFVVMELVSSTLEEEISDFRPDRLTNKMIQSRMKDLLTGLQQLHDRNIIHRDIKPPNLLIDHNGCLKICDFGISIYDTNGNKTPQMMTQYYKPPEVLEGSRSYSKNVDMWSAGCVFGEMFKTDALFLAKNDKELREMIEEMIGDEGEERPPELMRNIEMPENAFQLLESLLKRNPARRINAIDALRHEYFTNELTYN